MLEESRVTLVGAGPGSSDLITLRGLRALSTADVVFYDALVCEELLQYAPQALHRIYVGKRANIHAFSQEVINQMLVDYAISHGHVVRLKGGDSFVFGRGHEEVEFIRSHGIKTEVVPGISSAIAVPALQGIPMTHRGTSESFWVITGTTSNGNISEDLYTAVKTKATVVILMAFNKLNEIVSLYQSEGLGELPIAIIQNGATNKEKYALGKIDSIQRISKEKEMGTPAVIVIGEVVSLHEVYHNFKESHELIDIK